MRSGALERLVGAARGLPGDKAAVAPLAAPVLSDNFVGDLPSLRRRTGALLEALAARLEPAFVATLERAARAWDQVDTLDVLDEALRHEAHALRAEWVRAGGAHAVEAVLTLDAALAVVTLLERRLATLARLRLRGEAPELLPGGRPFLDVAAALAEAARGWQ